MWRQEYDTLLDELFMGLRGPSPVDASALKLLTAQWAYLLFGLRDGHPELMEHIKWQPWWIKDGEGYIRIGAAERIVAARIVSARGENPEKAILVHEQWVGEARKNSEGNSEVNVHYQPARHITKDITLPESSQFGSTGTLIFPPISSRLELWEQLKHPRSMKDAHRTINAILRWTCDAGDFKNYQIPEGREAELYRATRLWNYPKDKERPTSDGKRIEFFAKALAGLMLGISPATATKRLSHWKLPQLWKANPFVPYFRDRSK